MRVKVATNPPLPALRAWFSLARPSAQPSATVASFKALLCTSLAALHGVAPASLRLSVDDFELLDESELAVVRDGDLVCVDVLRVDPPAASHKRKRRASTSSSSSSESESTSSSPSSSTSDSDDATPPPQKTATPSGPVHPATFVPPGYGKPQTRSRNLRRRLKRCHERDDASVTRGGPVSGANATASSQGAVQDASPQAMPALLSLSLRNKNKAKNFKSLIGKPLAPKIIFGDEEPAPPRLIPPSSRSSLPANLFVTSVDVEAGMHARDNKRKGHVEYGDEPEGEISLDYGNDMDVDKLEAIAEKQWAALAKLTSKQQVARGTVVGYHTLGIDPETYTPEERLDVVRVVSVDDDDETLVVQPLRARAAVSFGGPVEAGDRAETEEERHTWDDVISGDWRVLPV